MSEIKDGGPAFPRIEPASGGDGPRIYFGMTLRDYFAAKAMASLILDPWYAEQQEKTSEELGKGIASDAYVLADAMLEARK